MKSTENFMNPCVQNYNPDTMDKFMLILVCLVICLSDIILPTIANIVVNFKY